jgi:plasmid stabilization system protein ParE
MKPLALHPSARRELREAIQYFNRQEEGLGDEFADEVRRAFARIQEQPHIGASAEGDARRVLIARFHYGVIYLETDIAIAVMAVMHQRRRPGYWLRRRI